MDSLIFWAACYFAVGGLLVRGYYRHWLEISKQRWPYRSKDGHERSAAWCALGLLLIWPYYEAGRWVLDTLTHRRTAKERAAADYEKAKRIIAEYRAWKRREEQEERERFDKELGEE